MSVGYDLALPTKLPFAYIESEERIETKALGTLSVLTYGALNVYGLIGPEKGGVAVVHEDPGFVIGTKDVPYAPDKRQLVASALEGVIKTTEWKSAQELVDYLKDAGYDVRVD